MTIKYLVLSGGGPNGLYQLGAIKKLSESYISMSNIEHICGTSIGTLIAILLCLNIEVTDIEDYCVNKPWIKSFVKYTNDILEIDKEKGFIKHEFIKDALESFYKSKDIDINITFKEFYEICNVKLSFYCIKLSDFSIYELSYETTPDMPVILGCLASCSIPPIFGPIEYDGEYYIDGGFINNYPINSCLSKGYDEDEIFGLQTSNAKNGFNLSETDTFSHYLINILGNIFMTAMTDEKQKKIKHHYKFITEYDSSNYILWKNFAHDIEIRKNMIKEGYEQIEVLLKHLE
jgi:predicted acylesterase/phospholipase RssA